MLLEASQWNKNKFTSASKLVYPPTTTAKPYASLVVARLLMLHQERGKCDQNCLSTWTCSSAFRNSSANQYLRLT
eukprot:1159502-Pelagomonas_calceolata.AAC.16